MGKPVKPDRRVFYLFPAITPYRTGLSHPVHSVAYYCNSCMVSGTTRRTLSLAPIHPYDDIPLFQTKTKTEKNFPSYTEINSK